MFGIFRTWLAVMVLVHHFIAAPYVGYWAVTSFFLLSGFLMTLILRTRYGFERGGLMAFARNRALRLYPAYWATLGFALLVLLAGGAQGSAFRLPDSAASWIYNASMVFPSAHPISVEPRLVTPTWALTLELFFYALMALGLSRFRPVIWAWLLLSLAITFWPLLNGGLPHIDYGTPWGASLPFALGAFLAVEADKLRGLWRSLPPFLSSWLSSVPLLAMLFLLNQVAALLVGWGWGEAGWKLAFLGSWINLALTFLLTLALFDCKPKRSALRAFDAAVGDYSYPVYLLHMPAAYAVIAFAGLSVTTVWGFSLASMLTFLLSACIIHGVDQPLARYKSRT